MTSDEHTAANHAHWDEVVAVHAASEFYDVPSFLAGENKLKSIERKEVGDVAGRSLLHLQCHFGLDTLSWARQGARVTGLDFLGAGDRDSAGSRAAGWDRRRPLRLLERVRRAARASG